MDALFWMSMLVIWGVGMALICAVVVGAMSVLGMIRAFRKD